jgi:hypothetical protein
MTTPTDGEWMSAYEALEFLQLRDAKRAICRRAHAGQIKARAQLLTFQGKEETDVEVPPEFWWAWANGEDDLKQDWDQGDFDTWLEHRSYRVRAVGVEFRRSDIEKLKPAPVTNLRSPPSPAIGRTVFIGHGHSPEWRALHVSAKRPSSIPHRIQQQFGCRSR